MRIEDLKNTIQGHWIQCASKEMQIEELVIDSRSIFHPQMSVFFALEGTSRDGTDFIIDAYQKGVRNFVLVSSKMPTIDAPDANFIGVDDTLKALQSLGLARRLQHSYPIVGITGSNGKTIVKEWLSRILAGADPYCRAGGLVKSPKSFNSQIGVPLSVWNMQTDNTIAIFEAGISKPKEMAVLEEILQPQIGVWTNLGDAHSENFPSEEEKMREKLLLFRRSEVLVMSADARWSAKARDFLKKINPKLQIFSWSYEDANADIFIQSKKISRNHCTLRYRYEGKEYNIQIPFTQEAYIENVLNVLGTLLILNVDFDIIHEGLSQLKAVAMRLELREALNQCFIISDSYNSDLSSLRAALEYLAQQVKKKKTLILSDMQESVANGQELAEEICKLLKQYQVDRFIGIGTELVTHQEVFLLERKFDAAFFNSTDDFLDHFQASDFHQELILLKGARKFEFERIQNRLELKIHHTILEVDLEALGYNFKLYRQRVKKDTKIMAMVKAHSYGSGSLEIAQKLALQGADYLAVAYTDEGIELRKGGINLPIMVMSPEVQSFESMIRWRLEPEIFNNYSIQKFIEVAQAHQESHYPIHIKLDTGMHRLGFEANDIDELLHWLQRTDTVRVASIFSHLAGSDEAEFDDFTLQQNEVFEKMSSRITKAINYKPIKHLLNSAGIVKFPNLQKDMVRLGIGLYGIDVSDSIQNKLHNVSTLKTYIVQIRNVPAGDTVGYSRRGVLSRDSKIATVAIGYADGYFRDFGRNKGYMLVHGKPAPLVGNVCMDMCMLDVTDIDAVQEGDEVIVFGKDLPVSTLARWANTICYEVLTSISRRVARIYINA